MIIIIIKLKGYKANGREMENCMYEHSINNKTNNNKCITIKEITCENNKKREMFVLKERSRYREFELKNRTRIKI